MTKETWRNMVVIFRAAYPKDNLIPSAEVNEIWYRSLSDIPDDLAELVASKWVQTNKWPPTIADIRQTAADIQDTGTDWGKAWEQTMTAIHKYGAYRVQEALNSLDDLTREVVDRIGFLTLCDAEDIRMDRANFRKIYEQLEARKKMDSTMRPETVAQIAQKKAEIVEALETPKEEAIEEKDEGFVPAPDSLLQRIRMGTDETN